jgi:hypothetical protein
VPDEIEGVLDPARSPKRRGIQRDAELLRSEISGVRSQLYSALDEPSVQIVGDQAAAELDEHALRERRRLTPQAIQNHLPALVEHGLFDGSGIRLLLVRLQQRHSSEQCRGLRRRPARLVRVHPGQLSLERRVEQLMPVSPQEGEEPAHSLETATDTLLNSRQRLRRRPFQVCHGSTSMTPSGS